MRCAICLQDFKSLRFNTRRIKICGRCVNSLNEYKEVAEHSINELKERLLVGILTKAQREICADLPEWKRNKASKILENPEKEFRKALPGWLNKMAADKTKTQKEYKILRACRRHLLHEDPPRSSDYPSNWKAVAKNIRIADQLSCVVCKQTDTEIHVHHIVYLSNFGTHAQENLVSLCKTCHEDEHERELDFDENKSC